MLRFFSSLLGWQVPEGGPGSLALSLDRRE